MDFEWPVYLAVRRSLVPTRKLRIDPLGISREAVRSGIRNMPATSFAQSTSVRWGEEVIETGVGAPRRLDQAPCLRPRAPGCRRRSSPSPEPAAAVFLLKAIRLKRQRLLAVDKMAPGCERQWKGVISWILGIAGTRQFLRNEGFTWIALVSTFLDSAVQSVDITSWPSAFPKSSVVATRDPHVNTRYPD
jgi:hypothetical protein